MNTIKITIGYTEDLTINNEYTTKGPVEITWFPDNDLIIETKYEKITVNTDKDEVVIPKVAGKDLEIINADLKLAKNNVARYVIIDDKYAYRLPVSDT